MKFNGFVFTVLLASVLCTGCKKGDDDPKLSLRSRKARISGDWLIESGRASLTLYNYSELYKLDGSRITIYSTPVFAPVIGLGVYKLRLQIEKDGTFKFTENRTSGTLEGTGTWNFTSGIGEDKKKESVVFTIDEITKGDVWGYFLFNQFNTTFSYQIKELRNKRLVITAGGSIAGFSDGRDLLFTIDYTLKQP